MLPKYNNKPGIYNIIIINNCFIYYNPYIKAIYAKKGVFIEYLPLYCPIFNPIKESFRDFKLAI